MDPATMMMIANTAMSVMKSAKPKESGSGDGMQALLRQMAMNQQQEGRQTAKAAIGDMPNMPMATPPFVPMATPPFVPMMGNIPMMGNLPNMPMATPPIIAPSSPDVLNPGIMNMAMPEEEETNPPIFSL